MGNPRWESIGRSLVGFYQGLNKTGQPRLILDSVLPTMQVDRHWTAEKLDVFGMLATVNVPQRTRPSTAAAGVITNMVQFGGNARITDAAHGLAVGDHTFLSDTADAGINDTDTTGFGAGIWEVVFVNGVNTFDVGPIVLVGTGAGGTQTGNAIATIRVNAAREIWIWRIDAFYAGGPTGFVPVTIYRALQGFQATVNLGQGPAQTIAAAWLQPDSDLRLGPLTAIQGAHLFGQTATLLGVDVLTIGPTYRVGDDGFGTTSSRHVMWQAGDSPPLRLQADQELVIQNVDPNRLEGGSLEVNVWASAVFRPTPGPG